MSEHLYALLSDKLDGIAALYKVRPRLTLIVRFFATKAPTPAPTDEVREAAEVRRLLPGWIERDICDWQFRCAVEDMLAALDAAGGKP